MKCTQCMADNGATILINEEGQFTVCEHYLNEHIVGNIDNPNENDLEELKYWKQYTNNKELCDECPILGDCIKVKGCVDMGDCYDYKKNWHIQKRVQAGAEEDSGEQKADRIFRVDRERKGRGNKSAEFAAEFFEKYR